MTRDERIQLRVSSEDLAEIRAAATACGMSLTEYMVSAAIGRARGNLDVDQALDVIRQALGR